MSSYGGPPHSFPQNNGGPETRNRGHTRRGSRRRLPRPPPAWVRSPLVNSFSTASTTTTTTTRSSNHLQHHNTGALQPITRFLHPQDPRLPDGPPVTSLMDGRFRQEILRVLNDATPDKREQLFWDVFARIMNQLYLGSPSQRFLWPWQHPRPQNEIAVYTPVNRYKHEFEEEKELGHGGFGRVVRARNKLDGNHYAVKMIITDEMGELSPESCVEEVRTLAKLDHPRVVRYITAWVQHEMWLHDSQWTSATVRELSSDISDSSNEESSSDNSVASHTPAGREGGDSPSDDSVVFQDTGRGQVEAHPPHLSTQSIQQQARHTRDINRNSRPLGALMRRDPWRLHSHKKVLYIQMRLCGESLSKWMDDRNTTNSPVVMKDQCLKIFRQVVEAMRYIHQEGYMHRDIKPANIFFTLEGRDVQLGDFGLARLIVHPSSTSPAVPNTGLTPQNYTVNVGTPLYTAPEVKRGNYDEKSDMYSLGIILLELFKPFKTDYEKSHVISALKKNGNPDAEMTKDWPDIAHWIERLVNKDPAKRPSAEELLESFPQPLLPPSPTSTSTPIIEDMGAGALTPLALTTVPQVVGAAATNIEVYRSELTRVSTLEINNITTEEFVGNNCTVRIEEEERLSKDEQIAVLKKKNDVLQKEVDTLKVFKEENYVLKEEIHALKRMLAAAPERQHDPDCCNNDNIPQDGN